MTGFEPATFWSQTRRATNCATFRTRLQYIKSFDFRQAYKNRALIIVQYRGKRCHELAAAVQMPHKFAIHLPHKSAALSARRFAAIKMRDGSGTQ